MGRKILSLLLVTVAAFVASASPALASGAVTGDPWIDQYIEQVPTAAGPHSSSGHTHAGLSQGQINSLQDAGGSTFAAVTAASVPSAARSASASGRRALAADTSAPSVPAALASTFDGGSGGLGPILPAALIGTVIGAFLLAAARQRKHHD